jgi:5'-AMP-activated protein kinase catalytic alpha subunit
LDKVTTSNLQLTNEVEALRRVQGHPNILRLVSSIEEGEHVFITTALCPNGSLFDYICNNGPLNEDEARAWGYQMFDAIRHCHEHGVVNRDLKPENILLNELMRLVLADFGLSALVGDVHLRNLSSATGSPVFAAPEVYSALKTPYAGMACLSLTPSC